MSSLVTARLVEASDFKLVNYPRDCAGEVAPG